ncbi:hypothetical protein BC777_2838 [Yoonia maricola]|uniref:Uncharacterized protein n=1 Tax=Yoonia maricola TaxID=420999 RepID=A0A2M8W6A8_9RHOB|nr:hypothetical protein BC777_2838 [Yoonia maricola]
MRALIITILVIFATFTQASAQTIPVTPTLTYPEPGTFCGLLKLCPNDDVSPRSD